MKAIVVQTKQIFLNFMNEMTKWQGYSFYILEGFLSMESALNCGFYQCNLLSRNHKKLILKSNTVKHQKYFLNL